MAKEFDYREYLAEGWLFKDRGISVDKVKDRLMKIYKSKYGDNDTIKGHVAVEFDDEDGNLSGEYVYIQPDSIEYHADRQAAGIPIDKWDDEIVNAVWKNLKKKKYFPVGVEENLNEEESLDEDSRNSLMLIAKEYNKEFWREAMEYYNGGNYVASITFNVDPMVYDGEKPEKERFAKQNGVDILAFEYNTHIKSEDDPFNYELIVSGYIFSKGEGTVTYDDEGLGFDLASGDMASKYSDLIKFIDKEVEKDKYSMDVDECDAGLMNEADKAIALFHKKMNS